MDASTCPTFESVCCALYSNAFVKWDDDNERYCSAADAAKRGEKMSQIGDMSDVRPLPTLTELHWLYEIEADAPAKKRLAAAIKRKHSQTAAGRKAAAGAQSGRP